jgi:L-alanine-DL-glutamate epimerase-like enolase superfamily enzyme
LTQQTRTPLGVWRAIHGPAEILALARAEAARFIVVSPDRIGGLQAARRCAAVAEAAGLAASLASLGTAGVACAAAAHVAAATPSFNSAHEFACVHATENVLAEPLEIVDGLLTVPLGPGLGVTIDRTKLEEFQAV